MMKVFRIFANKEIFRDHRSRKIFGKRHSCTLCESNYKLKILQKKKCQTYHLFRQIIAEIMRVTEVGLKNKHNEIDNL